MTKSLTGMAGDLAEEYPEVWSSYAALGKATADCGPLSTRKKRLVKLALVIGTGSEGAVHTHPRRGRSHGIQPAAKIHVAILAIGLRGLQRAVTAIELDRRHQGVTIKTAG